MGVLQLVMHATLNTPRRRGRPKTERIAAIDAGILDILRADFPQSVRHVFYRMTDPTLPASVPKTESGYICIQRRCTALRRSGDLPYHWLTDATRRGFHVHTFGGGGELIERFAGLYRVNLWEDASEYVEVWTESRSIAGVIQGECERMGVSLYPAGGFTSLTLAYQAAENIGQSARGRPVRIVYIGDYDPAGVLIDRDVIGKLRGHLPDLQIDEQRIAITPEQAAVLPSKPRKASDPRRPEIRETVEAEAMPAGELRRLLRVVVEACLPPGALAAATAAEDDEREGLRRLAALTSRYGAGGIANYLDRYVVGGGASS